MQYWELYHQYADITPLFTQGAKYDYPEQEQTIQKIVTNYVHLAVFYPLCHCRDLSTDIWLLAWIKQTNIYRTVPVYRIR